jgi:DNA topoisomerase-1
MPFRVIAGDCTAEFEGSRSRTQRGHVVCLVKPDDTVLVHDADGYQPVAWLTRPEELTVGTDPSTVTARDGDQRLEVRLHREHGRADYPASPAGVPVGRGAGDAPLVRVRGSVVNTDTGRSYGLPAGATVTDATCDCGLPLARVRRGATFRVCVDRSCDPLEAAVAEAFDREWDCPGCGAGLRVGRGRRGVRATCPTDGCDTAYGVPDGRLAGTCDCGLPAFRGADGRRCLDAACERT